MALDPAGTTLYALVAGGVVPVDTADDTAARPSPPGLAVSSVYSPHGIGVSTDGSTVFVVGQGRPDFGGRVLPIAAATGTPGAAASFDKLRHCRPGRPGRRARRRSLLVVDAANNWVNPVPLATFANPPATGAAPDPTGRCPQVGHRAPHGHRRSARPAPAPSWWTASTPCCPTPRRPRPSASPSRCAPGPRRWPSPRPPDPRGGRPRRAGRARRSALFLHLGPLHLTLRPAPGRSISIPEARTAAAAASDR